MKMDTALRAQVESSTVCSETEHCLAGTGGRLNCSGNVSVAGANFSWVLDSSGPKSNWALALSLNLGALNNFGLGPNLVNGSTSQRPRRAVLTFPFSFQFLQKCPCLFFFGFLSLFSSSSSRLLLFPLQQAQRLGLLGEASVLGEITAS